MKHINRNNLYNTLYYSIVIIGLALLLGITIDSCHSRKTDNDTYAHNIEALNDTIKVWKTKAGQAVAEKKILIGDVNVLKTTNDSLYNKIKELKLKNPASVVYIKSEVNNEARDTIWKYKYINNNMTYKQNFDFSDKYRKLAGNIQWTDSTMMMKVEKDIVYLDYIVAAQDGKAVVSSSNPYVKMTEISGITVEKPKKKHWHIGPYAGYGVSIHDGKVITSPEIGIGVTFSIISF